MLERAYVTMNVVQNKKRTRTNGSRKPSYRKSLNFHVQEVSIPDQVVNRRVLNEISKDVFGNTTTIVSSDDSQLVLALTEGRELARGEVGIAALDVNSPTLILCQISDSLHYTDTLNKIQILNPQKILLPDTMFETVPKLKIIELIKETFNHISIIPVQRRHFNDKLGLEQVLSFGSRKSINILRINTRKYYCLSAASALLSYLKNVNKMSFGNNCLRVEYQTKQDGMMIDTQTSARLELLYSVSNEIKGRKKFSLFSILNKCETRIGQRHLRANILEPSCSIDFIRSRQEQIKVLMENQEVLSELKENLQNFRSVDQLLKISCIVPVDDCEKAVEQNIQMALLLKHCLESVKPLCEVIEKTVSDSYEDTRVLLSASIFSEMITKIDETLQPDIHKNRLAQKHFQHLFAVKGKVNETIDFLRKLYTEATDKIREYTADLTEESQLPIRLIHSTKLGHHLYIKNPNDFPIPDGFNVIYKKGINVYMTTSHLQALNETTRMIAFDIIRMSNSIFCDMLLGMASEIDALHYLIVTIISLDLVQSFATTSIQESYCCPSFGRVMKVEKGFHPMITSARNNDNVITNNVIATPQYNFYLISGPNMSGKTIYIKMIPIIQIMAQIGCFVPAKTALLRMTDKIFSRIGFQDNFEQGASSFTVELREMEFIYSNLTPNSLVIIDELCRSTNPQEGELICWKFCEKLVKFSGISDENYFKSLDDNVNEDDEMNETVAGKSRRNTSLQIRGANLKLKDVARPFIYMTTHFTSLLKLSEKFNNAINLHMLVKERIVDEKPRLEFKYQIQSGPTPIKNYGLALARCIRFPSSLIDRAEEVADQIHDETLLNITNVKSPRTRKEPADETMDTTSISNEIAGLDEGVLDLYSHVLFLMSTTEDEQELQLDTINFKLASLIDKMSTEFKEMLNTSSLEEIVSILNASIATEI